MRNLHRNVKEENKINKTLIEWVLNPDNKTLGYTWNPASGCKNHTPEGLCLGGMFPCYAFKLANGRLKQRYLANNILPTHDEANHEAHHADPFYPRFWPSRIDKARLELANARPRGIFTVDMGELFGDWIPGEWQDKIFAIIKSCPQHRFYLLTKQPQNLIKWSPFPENCWVGVTATTQKQYVEALPFITQVKAHLKFASFEPLLDQVMPSDWIIDDDGSMQDWAILRIAGFKWVIIGACTGTLNDLKPILLKYPSLNLMPYGKKWTLQPKVEWVKEIVEAADKAGIPVFLKDNLKPLLEKDHRAFPNPLYWKRGYYTSPEHPNIDLSLRQEMPK